MTYGRKEIDVALRVYDELGTLSGAVRKLGYPNRKTLYSWLKRRASNLLPEPTVQMKRSGNEYYRTPLATKLSVLERCFERGERVVDVALELGINPTTIYTWRKQYTKEGWVRLMLNRDKDEGPKGPIKINKDDTAEVRELKEAYNQLRLEADILRETIKVIKKDPGVDPSELKNSEKVVIVDALRKVYSLPTVLTTLRLARSSYYYHLALSCRTDKYLRIRSLIRSAFNSSHGRYGYRRIKVCLAREGYSTVSEKVIRHLMKEEGLVAKGRKRRRFSSYLGEISADVPNLLERDFTALRPNEKWLTDLTEFSIPAGKVYLSPIIDCYDGYVVSRRIGVSPNARLVNQSLDDAAATMKGASPILHSDRGGHYRWPGWIRRTKDYGITRSMSKKGCLPDNAACEGFFGRLKNECFYGHNFNNYSIRQFIKYLDQYIDWYNYDRLKLSLNGMSPAQYRRANGYNIP